MAKRKRTKGQTTIYNHTYKTKDRATRTPLITGGELKCFGRASSSCSTSDTGCVILVTKPVISHTAGNRHKQNSWFGKEIREDNFRFWWRRVHEDASQGMYMSKIEIFFFTTRILQNQRMLCCGECFHD